MLCVGDMCASGCFVQAVVLSMFVSDALGDHMVEAYSSTGLVMALYMASMVSLCFPHLVEVRTFEYIDCFARFGGGQVYVSVVSEFGVKCES